VPCAKNLLRKQETINVTALNVLKKEVNRNTMNANSIIIIKKGENYDGFEHFKARSYTVFKHHFLRGNMFSLIPQKIASKPS